jgi:hypothetical protein
MDTENERTVKLGCWDAKQNLTPSIEGWTSNESTPDFTLPEEFCHFMNASGFGKDIPTEDGEFWVKAIQKNWGGDDGRRRARMLRRRSSSSSTVLMQRCRSLKADLIT